MNDMNICKDCKYFANYTAFPEEGDCHRFPPIIEAKDHDNPCDFYPRVNLTNWCGEFAPLALAPEPETGKRKRERHVFCV